MSTQPVLGKNLSLAAYLLLLSFGLLSCWSTTGDVTGFDYSIFLPLGICLLIILLLTYLTFRSARLVYQLLIYLLSLYLISTIPFPILQLTWTKQMVTAFVYLLSLGSIIGLMVLQGRARIAASIYMISISYACLLLLVLLITHAIPDLYRMPFLILMFGQAVCLWQNIVYSLFAQGRDEPVESVRLSSTADTKAPTDTREIRKILWLYIIYILFVGLLGSNLYPHVILLLFVFIFSLFLLAALMYSFYDSLLIHGLFLLKVVALGLVTTFIFPVTPQEWVLITFLLLSLGSHLFIFLLKHNRKGVFNYLSLVIIFLAGLSPLVHSTEEFGRIALLFIASYSISQGLSILLFPEHLKRSREQSKASALSQAARLEGKTGLLPTDNYVEKKQASERAVRDRHISAAEREKELTLQYKQWLVKKGEKLGLNFLQKND